MQHLGRGVGGGGLQQRLQLALAEVEGVAGADDTHAQIKESQGATLAALVGVVEADARRGT
jgi:hypothetical protein